MKAYVCSVGHPHALRSWDGTVVDLNAPLCRQPQCGILDVGQSHGSVSNPNDGFRLNSFWLSIPDRERTLRRLD